MNRSDPKIVATELFVILYLFTSVEATLFKSISLVSSILPEQTIHDSFIVQSDFKTGNKNRCICGYSRLLLHK